MTPNNSPIGFLVPHSRAEPMRLIQRFGLAISTSSFLSIFAPPVSADGIRRLFKLEQRTQVIRSGRVNDDDALALYELGDDVVVVNRREQQHRDGRTECE